MSSASHTTLQGLFNVVSVSTSMFLSLSPPRVPVRVPVHVPFRVRVHFHCLCPARIPVRVTFRVSPCPCPCPCLCPWPCRVNFYIPLWIFVTDMVIIPKTHTRKHGNGASHMREDRYSKSAGNLGATPFNWYPSSETTSAKSVLLDSSLSLCFRFCEFFGNLSGVRFFIIITHRCTLVETE